jgi:hypothetical protein
MKVFPCFDLENSLRNLSKHFRYTLYILSGEIRVLVFITTCYSDDQIKENKMGRPLGTHVWRRSEMLIRFFGWGGGGPEGKGPLGSPKL